MSESPALCQALRISIDGIQCVIELALVERVIPLLALQQVPGAPHYLVGLMNYHGESIAVVDLGLWLGVENSESYTLDTPIVLCRNGDDRVGFVVDQVIQSESVEASTPQMQMTFEEAGSPFLAALNSETGLSLLLNMPFILKRNFASHSSSLPVDLQLSATLGSL